METLAIVLWFFAVIAWLLRIAWRRKLAAEDRRIQLLIGNNRARPIPGMEYRDDRFQL